jgi:hypothetical protein
MIISVIHSKHLLIGLETVVMLPKYMYDELFRGLVHRLGQTSQLPNFNYSLHLCLRLKWMPYSCSWNCRCCPA